MKISIAVGIVAVCAGWTLASAGSPAIAGKPAAAPDVPIAPFGSPNATHYLNGVDALSSDDVWAVGVRSLDGSHGLTWIRHFDGNHWVSVPGPSPGQQDNSLRRVKAISDHNVWAVGTADTYDPLVEHWNGSSWSVVQPPQDGPTTAVDATGPDDVWVCGWDSSTHAYISRWDGTSWTTIPAADPGQAQFSYFSGIKVLSADNVWAVGMYVDSWGAKPLIEHWNGKRWRVPTLHQEASDAYLYDVEVASPDDIWAVGFVDMVHEGDTLVEHWDGTSWTAQTTSYGLDKMSKLTAVTAFAPDDVWATGYWSWKARGHIITQHWDGSAWSVVPAAEPSRKDDFLNDVAGLSSDNLVAVGGFGHDYKARGLVEHWDGATWTRER